MVEILKLGDKTIVIDGSIISLFEKDTLLLQLYYGGELIYPIVQPYYSKLIYPTENVSFTLLATINKLNFDVGVDGGSWRYHVVIVVTSDRFTDKAVKCQCTDYTGIFGRWVDVNNWYEIYLRSYLSTEDFRINKLVSAELTNLAYEAVDIVPHSRHLLKFSISGSTLKGYRNDMTTPKIIATDTTFASGAYGILRGSWASSDSTSALLGILLAPSSPLPPAKGVVEVEVVGTGTEDDPIRPNLKQELVEISKLTNIPEFLKQEAKRYEILKNKDFTHEEIKALLGRIPQHQINLASVTWGAFDHKPEHNTMLITITAGNEYVGDDAILKQIKHAKAKNLKVLKPPKDYREAVEQYKQLRKDFPEWLAGKDNYAYQTLGYEVLDYLQVADTYYGRIIEMNDKKAYKDVPDWEMRKILNMLKEKLKKTDVLKEEAEKHLKKLEEVEKKGW